MEVQPHVILFLDILGYKNILTNGYSKKSENEYLQTIHGLMASLSKYIEQRHQQLDEQNNWKLNLSRFKYLIFSDNILFFAPYQSELDMMNLYSNLIYGLSQFLFQYPKEDIFFRGAITKGPLYYDENLHFVFGSGLIRAYELESNTAIYPRIIIDNRLSPSPILVGWAQDSDDNWYIDYLALGYSLLCNRNSEAEPPPMSQNRARSCMEEQKKAICLALERYKSEEKVFKKYKWLANYHNNFCKIMKWNDLTV